MTLISTLKYLKSIGAHEDEIYALTHPRNNQFSRATIWELLKGDYNPKSVHLTHMRLMGMVYSLVDCIRDQRGISLAIERLLPRLAILGPEVCRFLCESVTGSIDPRKLEWAYQQLSISGSAALECQGKKLPDNVNHNFLLEAVSRTVVEVEMAGVESIRNDLVRRRTNLLVKMLRLYNPKDVLRAMFRGAGQCKDGDSVLFAIGKSAAFLDYQRTMPPKN